MIHTLKDLKADKLKGLKKLKLAEGLTEFPIEIYDLADSLEILDLSDNNLSVLPNDIIILKKLKIVFFENNKFTEFPSVLAQLPLLSMIGFKSNQIHTVPENSFPPLLRWLILTNNKIKKLPKSMGDCQFLQKFPVAGNLIEELPKEMANCHNLELLRISSNQLKTIPDWLFTLPKLSWIAFGGNPITNSIKVETTIKSYSWKNFKIKELLGQGASGIISKANWLTENKEVAVKVFKGSVTSDGLPEDEMKASIAAGNHKNLIPILGKIKEHLEDKNGLLMDLISSNFINLGNPPNLETCTRDVFIDKNFSLKEVIKIAKSMASVSLHLHNKGINHGDLYAHNILINQKSEILFGDFGAASFYNRNSQISKKIERVEVRAFGCLLEDLLNLVDKSEIDQNLYPKLKNLTELCLQPEVDKRPIFSDIFEELINQYTL
ncbi:leucine-rich repeat-containing serine/threonine-protein kinase [Polaribacter vadi]|uniref:leucine-rich repeat-containing protein kinase family protein n=1 Tax=Polaribacter TaxID=52959 RepID=UPI001C08834D|nr:MULTISPECIES: leucine-rich repeat-containing protein kinase family protein [Polaribacter]MBU3012386.1 leucine-rich repeat-containing serine/threonine-protein kinase [Polaribacter vadi]MDO6742203.1 leucine-rich repeat-containing protein kinase family protein [Polaribacter sp. 1_MG-2023]